MWWIAGSGSGAGTPVKPNADASLPVSRSILEAQGLAMRLASDYPVLAGAESVFLSYGLNDTYLLRAGDSLLVARVYRAKWRTLSEVRYEVELIQHCTGAQVPVARPVPSRNGSYVTRLAAPEGARFAVLFTYAPGGRVGMEAQQIEEFGQTIGLLHAASKGFVSRYPRFHLDTGHLVQQPLRAMHPLLVSRPEDRAYIHALALQIGEMADQLTRSGLEMGGCHGDVLPRNAHRDALGKVTLFDFDCCGYGPLVYDLATFRCFLLLHGHDPDGALWKSFLAGYRTSRPLTALDEYAIVVFVVARLIWAMGLHTDIVARDTGVAPFDDAYFDRMVGIMRSWVAVHALVL